MKLRQEVSCTLQMKYIHDNNNTEYVIELYKDGSRADYLENNKVEATEAM